MRLWVPCPSRWCRLMAAHGLQVNGNTTNNTRGFTITGASSIGVLTNTVARFGGSVTRRSGALTKIDNGTLVLGGIDIGTGALTSGSCRHLEYCWEQSPIPAQISVTGPNGDPNFEPCGRHVDWHQERGRRPFQIGRSGSVIQGRLRMTAGTHDLCTNELFAGDRPTDSTALLHHGWRHRSGSGKLACNCSWRRQR